MENLPTYRLTQSGPEAQEILDQVNVNTIDIEQLKRLYQALNQSEPEIIEPNDTWPVANPEENVIYRVIDRVNTPPQYYSDYMWNGTSMVLMGQYNNAIDNEPTANSNNLVKSGGVYSFVHANGGAYDISAAHAVGGVLATYDDLADALGTNGANVPAAVRKGGMSIKFVLSYDNKYVQFRLMKNQWSTTVSDWQGVDDVPTVNSNNLVKSGGVFHTYAVAEKQDFEYSKTWASIPSSGSGGNINDFPFKKDDTLSFYISNTDHNVDHATIEIYYNDNSYDSFYAKTNKAYSKKALKDGTRVRVWYPYDGGGNITNTGTATLSVHIKTFDEKINDLQESLETTNDSIDELSSDVANIASLQKFVENNFVEPNYQTGWYINGDGTVVQNEAWMHSDEITLLAGETLLQYFKGTGTYVAAMSLVIEDGQGNNTYTPLYKNNTSSGEFLYAYTAKQERKLVLCSRYSTYKVLLVKQQHAIGDIYNKIQSLKDADASNMAAVNAAFRGVNADIDDVYIRLGEVSVGNVDIETLPSAGFFVNLSNPSFVKGKTIRLQIIDESGILNYALFNISGSEGAYSEVAVVSNKSAERLLTEDSNIRVWIPYNNGQNVTGLGTLTFKAYYVDSIYPRIEILEESIDGDITNSNFMSMNNDVEFANKVAQLKLRQRIYPNWGNEQLVLAHFSDIHAEGDALKNIINWCGKHSGYIDDIIHTGDNVSDNSGNPFDFWNIEGSEAILNCIGNHDSATKEGDVYDWTGFSAQDCYNKYFSDYIANWGVVYTTNLCYYYKDYVQQKVRLVVLDCMHFDSTQQSWLANTLESARTSELSVMIATHGQAGNMMEMDCTFSSWHRRGHDEVYASSVRDIVETFINNGGEFICYISGHTHRDKFGLLNNYPNQLQIVIDRAKADTLWCDHVVVPKTKSSCLFNLISIDTTEKLIRLVRIGSNYDRYMRHIGELCYRYADYTNQYGVLCPKGLLFNN